MKLKELIDGNTFMPVLQQLQQRTWLMHWGLYVFFNHENGRNLIIDNLFQDRCGCLSAAALRSAALQFPSFKPTCFDCVRTNTCSQLQC